jgi:hypothetical protein
MNVQEDMMDESEMQQWHMKQVEKRSYLQEAREILSGPSGRL